MIRCYIAKRDNPWEILLFSFCLLLPGLALIITEKPVPLFSSTTKNVRQYVTVFSPGAAHLIGLVVAGLGVIGIWLYFYAKGYTGPKRPSSSESLRPTAERSDDPL
jgi:drug/metabolite transporter (DMT)-like permease